MAVDADDFSSVVIFRLCGDTFAVPVADVREVVPYAWLEQPPRMPSFVQGVLNLGGVAVSVLRLDKLLGMAPAAIGLSASILIMRTSGPPLGLLVETVEGVRSGNGFDVLPVQEAHSFQGCVAAELDAPHGQAHLLSWTNVLMAEERFRLAQFHESAQQRLAELSGAGS